MFILKKGHQPGVYVPLRALFLVLTKSDSTPTPIRKVKDQPLQRISVNGTEIIRYFITETSPYKSYPRFPPSI